MDELLLGGYTDFVLSDFIPVPIRTFRHESGRGVIQTFTLPYNRSVFIIPLAFWFVELYLVVTYTTSELPTLLE